MRFIEERAEILSEALPYIQKYNKKTIVVKYGGNAMLSEELKRLVISDIVLMSMVGMRVVVVHGGGPEINTALKKMNIEPKFINGLRYTDEETMDVVQMVLCGKVGKDLVNQIEMLGGKAVNYCGIDGEMMTAKRLEGDVDYGLVGDIENVDPTIIEMALENGYIPVISSIAKGEQTSFNINADTAASEIAAALKAEKLLLLTDVRGICRDPKDESTLISNIEPADIPLLIENGTISGGMIPKIDCCLQAVRRGVESAVVLDGRIKHSILIEMLTEQGIGTMIEKGR